MSKTVQGEFECYACGSVNPIHLKKPTPFNPTIVKATCEVCESEFTLSFKLQTNKPGFFQYGFLANAIRLSERGKILRNERMNNVQVNSDSNKPSEVQNATI